MGVIAFRTHPIRDRSTVSAAGGCHGVAAVAAASVGDGAADGGAGSHRLTGFSLSARITVFLPVEPAPNPFFPYSSTHALNSGMDDPYPDMTATDPAGVEICVKSHKKSFFTGWILPGRHYSRRIAPDGHSSTQVPQSMQSPASTFAFPSSIRIAAAGQASTQVSHPVQSSGSTTAVMLTTPRLAPRGAAG